VKQIRQIWLTDKNIEEVGYLEPAEFAKIEQQGEESLKRWIDKLLHETTVAVVFISKDTMKKKYVRHMIDKSWNKKIGIIGVYIHKLKDADGNQDIKGADPFTLDYNGIRTYDWVDDNGEVNFFQWLDEAYNRSQKR
jgi:hypothetical protein